MSFNLDPQDLIAERDALYQKISDLLDILTDVEAIELLTDAEHDDLMLQLKVMDNYLVILSRRIARHHQVRLL